MPMNKILLPIPVLAVVMAAVFWSTPAMAVWEHSPFCSDTRLPSSESTTWEFSQVYTEETLFPAAFSCPANARVVIHFLNLSNKYISITSEKSKHAELIKPKFYRRLDLGVEPAGEHVFFLEFPDIDGTGDHCPFEMPGKMRCVVKAGTWPESEFIYRTALIAQGNTILPSISRLPAGRFCELYLAGIEPAASSWNASGYTFQIKPNEVTLTEFARPKGQTISGIMNSQAKIIIR